MVTDNLIEHIKRYEGFKSEPYTDTKGNWTVGYGRNLEANPLTADECVALFKATVFKDDDAKRHFFQMLLILDVDQHTEEMRTEMPWVTAHPSNVQLVLSDMAYNIGVPTLKQFTGMIHALRNKDYTTAAYELLNSAYAEDVKYRAAANARLLAGGMYQQAVKMLADSNTSRYKRIKEYL